VTPGGRHGSLVVFAKQPAPGRVKTRLCPPLTAEQAAELYGCMLDDVLEASAAAAARLGFDAVLAVDPPAARGAMARRAPRIFRVIAQRGGDLGARMSHAVAQAAAAGALPVVLRGSDSPALAVETLVDAGHALAEVDLVASPDPDGGYSLVGLRRPAPGLLDHPMSHGGVLEQTRAAAADRGLRVRLLEPGFDLDTAADLERLAAWRAGPAASGCRRTLAWLDRHRAWPGAAA
jgi:rSAM/selenodomain-associated transferase 1